MKSVPQKNLNNKTFKTIPNCLVLLILAVAMIGLFPAVSLAQFFGNGSDGAVTITGTVHLSAEMNYTDLTVNAGATLETHGYVIHVSGTLTNNGTITDSYSGGAGGAGGTVGVGGNGTTMPPHTGPTTGGAGTPGTPASSTWAGDGGDGGGGGGGGGGAWDALYAYDARGGNGGVGGIGGQGGGIVSIMARYIDNTNGVIHADGFDGGMGNSGVTGIKKTWSIPMIANYDLAGGGGGGGAGGNGGDAGSCIVTYGTDLGTGTGIVRANGGSGGGTRSGGSAINTSYSAHSASNEEAGNVSNGNGGSGGWSEKGSAGSNGGATSGSSSDGTSGMVMHVPALYCYVDNDDDGYGDNSDAGAWHSPGLIGECLSFFSDVQGDCDDHDPNVNPDATEICGNGIDDDCNPATVDTDTDGDGICDDVDLDDDNDGRLDISDPAPTNPDICGDIDTDGCDDCVIGTDDFGPLPDDEPWNDGMDTDGDGLCDSGDPDIDNDGVANGSDLDPTNPDICQDVDDDNCDDCSVGTDDFGPDPDFDVNNDGTDTDSDGMCDSFDPDIDNDGVANASDTDPYDPFACEDVDADGCDDCVIGTDDFGPEPDNEPWNDGPDVDGDGICDSGDPDNDNDGVPDASDPAIHNPDICGDSDGDGCDDCSVGTDDWGPDPDNDPSNDGLDTDGDGLCDSGDPDIDNDGVANASDTDPYNPYVCEDTDGDGCDDCVKGVDGFGPQPDSRPWNDGQDIDVDGLCDSGDPDADGDGYNGPFVSGPDCDDTDPTINPGATEIWYDGVDQNCYGWNDFDADFDMYIASGYDGNENWQAPYVGDCDDNDSDINPAMTDIPGDGIDQDCVDGDAYVCGDLNDDNNIDILDIVFLINYKYKGGSVPDPLESANVNHDTNIDILDIVHLINFKYKGGADPDCSPL
ncbi:MAG: hypothetical protein GY865_08495 [candidate division Zixibacteria bacterium]|nr:hypothetical protein [candidate division Zixibacteria bacterium]